MLIKRQIIFLYIRHPRLRTTFTYNSLPITSYYKHVRMYDEPPHLSPCCTSFVASQNVFAHGPFPSSSSSSPTDAGSKHKLAYDYFRPLSLSLSYPGFWGDSCLNIFFMMHFSLFHRVLPSGVVLHAPNLHLKHTYLYYTRNC